MTLGSDLEVMGFQLVQSSRGAQRFASQPTPYLRWWVHTYPDGAAEFTWEFELGAYLKDKDFAISVQDELSLLLFPRADARGPADAAWVTEQIAHAETMLGSVALLASG